MGVGSFRVATIGSVSFLTDRLNAELLVKAGYRSAWSAAQDAGAANHAASVEEAAWTALLGERRGRAPLRRGDARSRSSLPYRRPCQEAP